MQGQDNKDRRRPEGMVESIPAGTQADEERRAARAGKGPANTAGAMGVGTTYGQGGDAEGVEGEDADHIGSGLTGGPSDEDGDSVKDGGGI